ncbi:MAG: hypothetical protein KatS3mg062_0365 [Tepidiforma sp.]|nr:MAG: hypothetical protein KatS3mg062_0365 [Tepidiforma sp.]
MLAAAALAGCQGTPRFNGEPLNPLLCAAEDLSQPFLEQTRGDFTAADLGGLSRRPEERKAEYRGAGMEGGRFVFWKQALPRPPFESPVNVVCQVLSFETAGQAAAWVDRLEADPERIRDSGMLWAPLDGAVAEELPAERGRLFRLEGSEGDARVVLYALHEARGNLVLSVFVGDRDGRTLAATALDIAAARDARLGVGATSGSP